MIQKLTPKEIERQNYVNNQYSKKNSNIIILDNIRSRANVGSTFRICDAFGIEHLYLTGITPTPPHRDIHKTALGSEETVTWSYKNDILEVLKKLQNEKYNILGIEQTTESKSLNNYQFTNQNTALVFGNEIKGISEKVFDYINTFVQIPQYGKKHSLNVTSAISIVTWELTKPSLRLL